MLALCLFFSYVIRSDLATTTSDCQSKQKLMRLVVSHNNSKTILPLYLAYLVYIRWVSVVEFHDWALGIGKVFGQESTVVKWNYQILSLHLVTVRQKVPILDFQSEFSGPYVKLNRLLSAQRSVSRPKRIYFKYVPLLCYSILAKTAPLFVPTVVSEKWR